MLAFQYRDDEFLLIEVVIPLGFAQEYLPILLLWDEEFHYYSLTRIGSILSCATIRYAKRKHANISSFSKKGYPSNTSSIVEPEASIPRICSTAIRIPLITGFPLKISGLYVMRSRRSSLFISLAIHISFHIFNPKKLQTQMSIKFQIPIYFTP